MNPQIAKEPTLLTDIEERRAEERDTFLGGSRAVAVCAREFDALVAEVVRRVTTLEDDTTGIKADIRRSPGRCIVQFGPLALTLSWVRAQPDRVSDGRLMIIEWQGTVARAAERIPERLQHARSDRPAVILQEDVLLADATGGEDWRWRMDDSSDSYQSRDLAARCVDSIASTLQKLC